MTIFEGARPLLFTGYGPSRLFGWKFEPSRTPPKWFRLSGLYRFGATANATSRKLDQKQLGAQKGGSVKRACKCCPDYYRERHT
jgi:hypothetical protein